MDSGDVARALCTCWMNSWQRKKIASKVGSLLKVSSLVVDVVREGMQLATTNPLGPGMDEDNGSQA